VLQLLRIERTPLGEANTPSISQCRRADCTEAGQPLVGAAQADPLGSGESHRANTLIEVLVDQPQAAGLRQAGIGVAVPRGVGRGWWVAPQSVAASHLIRY
jgi:hypothetical protein